MLNTNVKFKALKKRGCKKLILQVGDMKLDEVKLATNSDAIGVEKYQYKESIKEEIERADLIIGHAGKYFLCIKFSPTMNMNCSLLQELEQRWKYFEETNCS